MNIWKILEIGLLIATVVVNLVLAAVVYMNNPRSATNRVYTTLAVIITLWLGANYISLVPMDAATSLFWIRLSIFSATPMLVLLVLFARTLPSTQYGLSNRQLIIVAALTAGVMGVCLSPFAFTSVKIVGGTPQPEAGPGIVVFMITAFICLSDTIWILLMKLRRTAGATREMFRYVMLGIVAMIVLLITTVLVPVVVLKSSRFVPMTPLYVSLFLGATTYAIVRHRLFDLRVLAARAASYVLLLTTLTGMYISVFYIVVANLVPGMDVGFGQVMVYMVLAVMIGFTLPPLRRFFAHATDRVFFSDHYDSQQLLDDVSSILASELELKPLSDKFLSTLASTMHITHAQLVVMNDDKIFYEAGHGRVPGGLLHLGQINDFKSHPLIITDELAPGPLHDELDGLHIRVVLQLRANREIIGYLALGDKLSGSIYSDQDLAVLEIMRKELSVAVDNAKAYDEIAQFNATLQQRIREATGRLRVANRNLRALDKTKDEFISLASHQLGTPLTAITGYLSMALDNDKHNMTADQREFVSYALEAAEKMVYMAGDMLNVSRLNSGRFMIQRQPTELVKIITQELHQLEPAAKRKGLALTSELPTTPITASLDESKTRQVIMNFIDNALYYTEQGGVHVKLSSQPGSVTFTVTDTGIGVPKAEQGRLFVKFFRAPNAKTVRPDGTGLGLYLAKRVIEDQGGTIIFASEEGKGSTFGFTLPV